MSEGWANNGDGQYASRGGYSQSGGGGEGQFGSRNFQNSNYRGPRREGGAATGGYQGGRPSYNAGAGGYGAPRTSGTYGQNGGGRQYYGERQPRTNFGGAPRTGGTYNNYGEGGVSSKIDIDSNKVGMVIGRGGGKIREIQENFNVHVKIDRDPGENGLTGVTIRGEEDSIEQAKNFIEDLVAVK